MTPSPLCNIESYPDPEAETETVLVDLSYTSMLTLPPGEKKGLLARFKEFMDPQERTPNVLRKPRPDKPSVKRSVSVDGRGVKSGKERFGGLSSLRASFSGRKTQEEDADTQPATAALEDVRSDSPKQKRSSWFHRPLSRRKSIRNRETTEADQRISQTPWEGDPSPTQSQSTPRTTTLSRTLSAPTEPTRLSIRNAFPPRRRPQLPLQAPSLASTLSNRDLDKWARNGNRVRDSHFIPPFRDPLDVSENFNPDIPAPWTAGEETIPSVPGPLQVRLQARRQPSRGSLRDPRNRRPVSQPIPFTSGDPAGPASATEPFPNYQQPSDLEFDAHGGQNNAWVESPTCEETYLSDARCYSSPFPVFGSSRPLSPSREASIAAGEAIAQEGEKYVACRPPPPVPVLGPQIPTQQWHEHETADQRLADNTAVELDAGSENNSLPSDTYGVVDLEATPPLLIPQASRSEARPVPPLFPGAAANPATLTSVPSIDIPTQHRHDHTPASQPRADPSVAELDAGPDTTVPTSRTYGVVEFAEELRGDRRRRSSEYSEDSYDREAGPASTSRKAAGPASWQQRGATLEGHVTHDLPEELLRWAGKQPSVLHQLTYQRLMDAQSPCAGEEEAGGRREGAPSGPGQRHEDVIVPPVAVDSSVEDTSTDALPVKRERPSSPVPVLYFTTVPPRNACA
ncbi:hypothetical protein LTR56_018140 [Elasticomyces elasticus]|nr:hypothetical protein LTR22_023138 [Elasticomyces elasticus]KAK3629253.1 hypothetical protein LTR56_018140 [Elasticomyces elasticus]KAK4912834.1 hypothetical protein LTR49_018796 [Elasticomyces elasticus]KAK5747312.1 hypothetical protein LTS12_022426 [Elasticomyces elasticus]